jgi:hypothetical protein
MTKTELYEILKRHAAWIDRGMTDYLDPDRARLDGARLDGARLDGARLDGARLHGASLDRARLGRARLDGASLDGASLDGASLVGASLVGASLVGASLVGASLDGASLHGASLWRATGIICLPVGDERGYRPVAVWQGDLWKIAAGCRWFTIEEARAHYRTNASASGSRPLAAMYLRAIDWLEEQPQPDKAIKAEAAS